MTRVHDDVNERDVMNNEYAVKCKDVYRFSRFVNGNPLKIESFKPKIEQSAELRAYNLVGIKRMPEKYSNDSNQSKLIYVIRSPEAQNSEVHSTYKTLPKIQLVETL